MRSIFLCQHERIQHNSSESNDSSYISPWSGRFGSNNPSDNGTQTGTKTSLDDGQCVKEAVSIFFFFEEQANGLLIFH
jgi:hypothetical protein